MIKRLKIDMDRPIRKIRKHWLSCQPRRERRTLASKHPINQQLQNPFTENQIRVKRKPNNRLLKMQEKQEATKTLNLKIPIPVIRVHCKQNIFLENCPIFLSRP